jgi:hypothetical protein
MPLTGKVILYYGKKASAKRKKNSLSVPRDYMPRKFQI